MTKLVGEGKPFHSAVDKAAGMLKRKVGTGAEFMKELMGVTGIKPTELQERGLTEIMGMPRMTHDQFMANLSIRPAPKIREKVLGGDQDDPNWIGPYHYQWTLPGGENYREMLIKAPQPQDYTEEIMGAHAKLRRIPYHGRTPEQESQVSALAQKMRELEKKQEEQPKVFPGVPTHFGGEPGILASMRLKDRTGPNGEKLLHLEELQSDWHQKGREHGYKPPYKKTERTEANPYGFETIHDTNLVPDAPFKKNWEEMAIKRLIHHAAQKGYHGIVMTPGAEQADRYSLAKHIDSIMLVPNPHPNKETHPYYFKAFDKEGNRVADDTVNDEKLQQYIGKEPAQQLLSTKPNPMGERMISGANIVSGGEGMKGFYDKKVPNIFNAVGKKHGVQMKLHVPSLGMTRDAYLAKRGIREENGNMFLGENNQFPIHSSQVEKDYLEENPNVGTKVHHFPITEPMRQDVLKNGLPLYNTGGVIHKAEGGNVQPLLPKFKE